MGWGEVRGQDLQRPSGQVEDLGYSGGLCWSPQCLTSMTCQRQVLSIPPPSPGCPVPGLAEHADFLLAATLVAAVAEEVSAVPQNPWGSLPAGWVPKESLRGLGQGQPLSGGHCLFRLGVCIWEGIPCER